MPFFETDLRVQPQANSTEGEAQLFARLPICDSGQIVQAQISDSNGVVACSGGVQNICFKWHTPQVNLFAARLNNKLLNFVSPVPDRKAGGVDALGIF